MCIRCCLSTPEYLKDCINILKNSFFLTEGFLQKLLFNPQLLKHILHTEFCKVLNFSKDKTLHDLQGQNIDCKFVVGLNSSKQQKQNKSQSKHILIFLNVLNSQRIFQQEYLTAACYHQTDQKLVKALVFILNKSLRQPLYFPLLVLIKKSLVFSFVFVF